MEQRRLVAEDHFGLVATIALKYVRLRPGELIEDTEEFADGLMGLAACLKNFEPERGLQFSTPAYMYVRHAIWSGQRKRQREKYFIPASNWDNENGYSILDSSYVEPEYTQDVVDQLHEFIAVQPDDNPDDLRNKKILYEIFFQGRTLLSIGNEIGLSKERIRQLRDKSIEQLRFQFHEVYDAEAYCLCQG
jgi:RNA polymerase sigma factor (sigma-70 family)